MRNSIYFLFVIFFTVNLHATIIHVPAASDSIQGGIDLASNGDTVIVQSGTYLENIDFKGKQILVSSIYLSSGDTSDISATIIDGGGSAVNQSVVSFINGENSLTMLVGFTITNGWASGSHGGGITFKSGSAPVIEDCRIKGNTATTSSFAGIGIYCYGSSPVFRRCLIKNNSVNGNGNYNHRGGGLYVGDSSAPTFYDCQFIDNKMSPSIYWRDWGGAVYSNKSNPVFTNCIFSGNSSDRGGAAMAENSSSLNFRNCIFTDNYARGNGGVIESYVSSFVLVDSCLIYHNSAGGNGGALYSSNNSRMSVFQSTITENSAAMGAGIYAAPNSAQTILADCIIFYNWFNDIYPADLDSVDYCDVRGGYPGTGNVDFDPLFCDWQTNDYHLASNSICMTSGSGGGRIGYFGSNCNAINPQIRRVPENYASIQEAIDNSYQGDTVLVNNGTYNENIQFRARRILLTSNFHTTSDTGDISRTIIDGGGSDANQSVVSFLTAEDSLTMLTGFTITNGWASGSHGGGITFKNGSVPIIEDCRIIDNTATTNSFAGIGIYCYGSSPVFRRCLIKNNSVGGNGNYHHRGGGLYVGDSSAPTFSDCQFIDNKMSPSIFWRDYGGAVYSITSTPEFTNCTFTGNSSDRGGAIYADGNSNLFLYNCAITNNNARGNGGAIESFNSYVLADSCPIYQNSAGGNGGAFYSSNNGRISVLKSTLTENSAAMGAGVYAAANAGQTMLSDCIIFYNWFNDIYPAELDSVIYCDVRGGYPGTGNVDFDPLFCDWQSNNYHLAANSICLTSGSGGARIGYFGSDCSAINPQTRRVPANYASIQEAINASYQGDTVLVENGTYTENFQFWARRILLTSNYYTSSDTADISKTILDGGGSDVNQSVVSFLSAEDTLTVLSGFTITNGWASGSHGGGITLKNGSDPLIEDCRIIDNTATTSNFAGIGIYCSGSSPIFRRCLIKNNSVTGNGNYDHRGGGVYIAAESVPHFSECQFIDNKLPRSIFYRDYGGAVYCMNSTPVFSHCIFKGNTADNGGSMNITGSGNVQISNSIFDENMALGSGSAIYCISSGLYLNNNLIIRNSSNSNGGGIYLLNQIADSIVIFLNNTFTKNSSGSNGGGISCTNSDPVIVNTIMWEDTAVTGSEIYSAGSTPIISYSNIQGGWEGQGMLNTDPLFYDSLSFFLSDISPCIDTGNPDAIYDEPEDPLNPGNALWPAMGLLRSDMGAYGGPGAITWDIVNSIEYSPEGEMIPLEFKLSQNYPNPFNPVTAIGYRLSAVSDVELNVYDILGQKVATLVSERQSPGVYKVEWDAGGFASGVYLYRLATDNGFVQTRKLVLLK